jgi:hypothetical protein
MNVSSNSYFSNINSSVVQAYAMTFQCSANNQCQQEDFFSVDNWYQDILGTTEIKAVKALFFNRI